MCFIFTQFQGFYYGGHHIFVLWFLLLLLLSFYPFPRLFSAVADWMSTILPHMMWPSCEFIMQVWNVLHAVRWKYWTQKIAKNSLSVHHRTTLSGCIFATKACIDNRKKTCSTIISLPHDLEYGELRLLAAEIVSGVWGTPANFNGFRVLASLLQRRRSPAANQTLHDVWCLPGCYTIYTFSGALAPGRILPGAKFTLRPRLAFLYIGSVTARHSSIGRQPNCGEVQGITELSQRAPPIFGWAAITLGIGPHSS